ncbi:MULTISPECIES: phosphonate degradation HD-domain oxygenase [Ramlibacter]|uniref:HD domain-containing protein n=1 Tax=Ramlibacter pinisoli TaxID=2682844 RepID=A0A6N8J2A8_9BURK|nr:MULTISPECIES: phosphonate degradation HD-domain oxygenase [Ramlibacter]MBA2962481.1 phosphohydrolase [Ramlibacter sp. CGMCC 1.13660]MVQ32423.1 HD domain-containing protein [Ramlibacter pinisoli]
MALTLDDIGVLFDRRGGEQYSGEPVTQLEHALQTAHRAEQAGAGDGLVTACLLHDLGHLVHDLGATPTLRGIDDVHQHLALPFLRGLFPDQVLGAIGGHVDAKRYLCAVRPGYQEALSEDSKRSLRLQGGVFTPVQADAFIARPGAADAVRLREWDDLAKVAGAATPPLAHFLERARRCALRAA